MRLAKSLSCVAALLLAGCIQMTPWTRGLGTSARPLTSAQSELVLAAGAEFLEGAGLAYPALEGTYAHGVTDWLALDLHGSLSGLQVGARLHHNEGPLTLSLVPQCRVRLNTDLWHREQTSVEFSAALAPGARFILATRDGTLLSVGYSDERWVGSGSGERRRELGAVLGHAFGAGALQFRPEVGFALLYGDSTSGWGVFAGLAVALKSAAPGSRTKEPTVEAIAKATPRTPPSPAAP